jgi:hypothetical protein
MYYVVTSFSIAKRVPLAGGQKTRDESRFRPLISR